jgi:hypothetical protein
MQPFLHILNQKVVGLKQSVVYISSYNDPPTFDSECNNMEKQNPHFILRVTEWDGNVSCAKLLAWCGSSRFIQLSNSVNKIHSTKTIYAEACRLI